MDPPINQDTSIRSYIPSLRSYSNLSSNLPHPYQTRFSTKLYHFHPKHQKTPYKIPIAQLDEDVQPKQSTPKKNNKEQRQASTASKANNDAKDSDIAKSIKTPPNKGKKISKVPLRDRFNRKIYYRVSK